MLVTIIGNPSKPISTRRQLATGALWCYFHSFLVKEELKNYREAMIESSWIEAMQEEIHEFEWLKSYREIDVVLLVIAWVVLSMYGRWEGVVKIPKAVGNDTSTSFDESLMNPSCDVHVEILARWDSASPLVNEDVSRDSGFSSHVSLAAAESNTHFGMESDRPAIGGKEAGKSSLFTTSQGLVHASESYIATTGDGDALILPNKNNIEALFGVTLTSLKDIDDLTRRLKAGEYEEVMSKMTREERKAALATIEISGKTNLNRVKGAAVGLKPKLSKSKANVHLLFSENLCEGVNFSIPRKVVETNNDELQRFFLLSIQNFCWELKVFILSTAKPRVSTAQVTTASTNQLVLLEISAINLDDYQLDPVTPPPSPSSPFTMAAYQRMIAETDHTRERNGLTGLRIMSKRNLSQPFDHENNGLSHSGIDTQLHLPAICLIEGRDESDEQSQLPLGDRVKFASSTLLDGALTWWNVYVRSVTLDTAHATPWSDFKAMFIRKYCPRNEVKQMENELWNLKLPTAEGVDDTTLTHALLLVTTVERQDIRLKAHERPSFFPQLAKRTQEAKVERGSDGTCLSEVDEKDLQEQSVTNNGSARRAPGRVYSLCAEAAMKDNNVVNGTFLINNVYASVLFDTGADRSFVSYAFSKYIDIPPTTLDTNYNVELADKKSLTTNTILRGCTLNLQNLLFEINLLPIELGSFDVIVGMDWMAEHRAEVVCYEILVPYGNDMLIIQGGIKSESRLEVISSIRTQKYIDQGCQVFLIQMMKEEKTKILEKEANPNVVRDFPEVFPEDLPGLPPTPQVEFHIELMPRATPVARTPYRLAPAEMKELAE
ncbi:putative reverse transcriptase domain-containing protein [Tanacetum coccineum]